MKNRLFVIVIVIIVTIAICYLFFANKDESVPSKMTEHQWDRTTLVRDHSKIYGNPEAKVVVVEFFDPECEACREIHFVMKRVIQEYGSRVLFVHRYMPFHRNSKLAAIALEEAKEHGKYDEALDILFERQPVWGSHTNPRPELITDYLEEIGITKEKLKKEYLESRHLSKVIQDEADGKSLGVQSTPTIFVNGYPLMILGEIQLRNLIEEVMKTAK